MWTTTTNQHFLLFLQRLQHSQRQLEPYKLLFTYVFNTEKFNFFVTFVSLYKRLLYNRFYLTLLTVVQNERAESIVGKRENAGEQYPLLFP